LYAQACVHVGLIAEVDACLDGEYNVHQAEKSYERALFNASNLANTHNCATSPYVAVQAASLCIAFLFAWPDLPGLGATPAATKLFL
jgi:hypothetical protein